jgi:hypothetical protein
MPTLNKYAKSNEKTGYFVRANVGGSHPVTLQTTDVAERIFDDNGYSDGSSVPTKLVWSMYDVDLLYTESSINSETPSHSFGSLSDAVTGSNLTEGTRQDLIQYFGTYSGPHQQEVSKVLSDLRRTTSTGEIPTFDSSEPVKSAKTIFDDISSASEHRIDDLLNNKENQVSDSLLTFAQRTSQIDDIEITDRPSIAYHFKPLTVPGDAVVYDLTVSDGRGSNGHYDYRVEYKRAKMSSVYVQDGTVKKVNGPSENLTSSEAQRLADEVTPIKIDSSDLTASVDAPAPSELSLPGRTFVQGESDIFIGVIDRISNSDNPVVELEDGHFLTDVGKKDNIYLINRIEPKWGRVLCELSHQDTVKSPSTKIQTAVAKQFPEKDIHVECIWETDNHEEIHKIEIKIRNDNIKHSIECPYVSEWIVYHEYEQSWKGIAKAYETRPKIMRALGEIANELPFEVNWYDSDVSSSLEEGEYLI